MEPGYIYNPQCYKQETPTESGYILTTLSINRRLLSPMESVYICYGFCYKQVTPMESDYICYTFCYKQGVIWSLDSNNIHCIKQEAPMDPECNNYTLCYKQEAPTVPGYIHIP